MNHRNLSDKIKVERGGTVGGRDRPSATAPRTGYTLSSRREEKPVVVVTVPKARRVDWFMVLMWSFVAFCFGALFYVIHALWTECHRH